MPPKELAQVLRTLPSVTDERLLVGPATFDDAGVYRLSAELALVQTIDFFPPMLDDPFLYGQIAAANALSDIYAMAAEPLTALSLVCFPSRELDISILGEILRGGALKATEANCQIIGGHSVRDTEIKFGLAVTGTVHPGRIASNAGARPGDRLFLTKPLGVGPVTSAYRKGLVPDEMTARLARQLAVLNHAAAQAMRALGVNQAVHAATDVTGFGLLGHARNIAVASNVTLVFEAGRIPVFSGALDFARQNLVTGAYAQNQAMLADVVELALGLDEGLQRVIFDSETSGGLLVAVTPEEGDRFLRDLYARGVNEAVEIGIVQKRGEYLLRVVL